MSYTRLSFELFVDDLQRTVAFYREVLGLEPLASREIEGYVPLSAGAVTIGVSLVSDLPAGHHLMRGGFTAQRGIGTEIVIEVDDVDAAYERAQSQAEARGGGFEAIEDRPWGMRDFRVIDPDGYYLRITSGRT